MKATFRSDEHHKSVCATLDKEAADRLIVLYSKARQKNADEGKTWWVPDTPKLATHGMDFYIASPRARAYLDIIVKMSKSEAISNEDQAMLDVLDKASDCYQENFVALFKSNPDESRGWRLGEDVFNGRG